MEKGSVSKKYLTLAAGTALGFFGAYYLYKRFKQRPVTAAELFLRDKYRSASNHVQLYHSNRLLEATKVHMIRFSSVDTTMRLADEFDQRERFL